MGGAPGGHYNGIQRGNGGRIGPGDTIRYSSSSMLQETAHAEHRSSFRGRTLKSVDRRAITPTLDTTEVRTDSSHIQQQKVRNTIEWATGRPIERESQTGTSGGRILNKFQKRILCVTSVLEALPYRQSNKSHQIVVEYSFFSPTRSAGSELERRTPGAVRGGTNTGLHTP